MTETQIRAQAQAAQLKVDALDWMNKADPDFPTGHKESCCSLDLTGHAAPCTCGYNERNKVTRFIREAIMKA